MSSANQKHRVAPEVGQGREHCGSRMGTLWVKPGNICTAHTISPTTWSVGNLVAPWPVLYHHLSVVRRMPEKPKHDPLKTVTESPISDVFEGRHPTTSEKEWAEQTLAP